MCYLQNSYIQNQNDTENFKIKGYRNCSISEKNSDEKL